MKYLKVKNWEKHQHYKDREPTWIKLHRELLNDYQFSLLPDLSKAHLMMIWLLASQTENKIPNDARWISQKIGATDKIDLNILISQGYLENHSVDTEENKSLYQPASPETEVETEVETQEQTELRDAVAKYNLVAERTGLPKCQKLTGNRSSRLKARLSDCSGIEGWQVALEKLEASQFLLGANNNGWKADFDFLLQEKSFTKLMEGGYDRSTRDPPRKKTAFEENMDAARELIGGR